MNKKIKNRIVFYTMLLVLFVIVNIVVSFAYLRGKANNNESVSTIAIEGVGVINVTYSSNTPDIVVEDILPGYETVKKFSVTSSISSGGILYNRGIWYQIKLIVDTNGFLSRSLVYSLSLEDTSSTDGITALPVDKISIPNGANSDGILVGTGYFSSDNVSHIYNLKINYVNLEDDDQSDDYQKKFAAHVIITNPDYINLTFDLNGGSFENLNLNSNSTMKVAANSTFNLPTPTKGSYAFSGWEVVSGNVSANNNVITTNDSDISLKAIWIPSAPYEFDYTGGEQEFIAEYSGYYKIETWGAQGGSYSSYIPGYGGYSTGIVQMSTNEKIYINVGGAGTVASASSTFTTGGYNGGGYANYSAGTGGGATHISKEPGLLSSLSSTSNILIVAGGGGGTGVFQSNIVGGAGGGIEGNKGGDYSSEFPGGGYGGTQLSGGSLGSGSIAGTVGTFGQGGQGGYETKYSQGSGGGGGGLYGGTGGSARNGGGGGGSGYIGNSLLTSKVMYCYNCTTSDVESTKTYSTTCAEETPTENCAKKGNGYARITYLHS